MIGNAMQVIRWLSTQKQDIEWEIKPHRRKRTLSQNAYYWQLIGQMADALRLPKEQVHNEMLRSYGQVQGIDGWMMTVPVPDTDEAERQALRATTYHIRPTSQVRMGAKNQMFRTYVMLKGSHEMNTEEMTILLDGTIQEAQALGIETLRPIELEAMRAYEQHHKTK